MKKFFSLIALVGVIAACTPEQVETAFKLAGGKVTVEVQVVDIINGGAYTGAYTVSSNFGTVSGNTITYQANESDIVPAGEYTVSVTGPQLAKTYTSTFAVPGVLAGGQAAIKVVVPVGEPMNGWTVDAVKGKKTEGENVYLLVNSHYPTHAYSHDGIDTWYYNNSEFVLEGTAEYKDADSDEVSNVVDNNLLGFEGVVTNLAQSLKWNWPYYYDDTYEFTVSAWAMWNVRQIDYWYECPVTVIASKEGETDLTLGGFDYKYVETVDIQVYELPYPGAPSHAHYHAGHGHDAHGSAANAGGGMAINE